MIGRFAWSRAGRDKDRVMIVTAVVDENHVLVCDGALRHLSRPKKKKLKHLEITERADEEIVSLSRTRRRLTDADIRAAVARFLAGGDAKSRNGEE